MSALAWAKYHPEGFDLETHRPQLVAVLSTYCDHSTDRPRQFFMLRLVAFCNATCEKVGQLYRETVGRPTALHYPEIVARMQDQISGGVGEIERMVSSQHNLRAALDHASIAASVTMSFLNHYKAVIPLRSSSCDSLNELADFWERSKEFREEQIE